MFIGNEANERQVRPKKRRKVWPSWLCSPRSLRLLIGFGQLFFLVARVVIEFVKLFRG